MSNRKEQEDLEFDGRLFEQSVKADEQVCGPTCFDCAHLKGFFEWCAKRRILRNPYSRACNLFKQYCSEEEE